MNEKKTKIPQWLATILKYLVMSFVGAILLVAIMCGVYYIAEYNSSDCLTYVVNSDQKTCTVTGTRDYANWALNVPEEIDGYIVTGIADGAFKESDMRLVILPDTIETIGEYAFYKCQSLSHMKLPQNVSVIGDYAFYGCTSWKNAIIPSSAHTIGVAAYAACFAIEEINVPASLINIGDMAFSGCSRLVNIIVDEANPLWKSVDGVLYSKDMKTIYSYPLGRKNDVFTIPEGVENIHYKAFALNTKLTTINLPSTIKTIGEEVFIAAPDLTMGIEILNYAGSVEKWKFISKPQNWGGYSSDFIIVCTDGQISKDGTILYK